MKNKNLFQETGINENEYESGDEGEIFVKKNSRIQQ